MASSQELFHYTKKMNDRRQILMAEEGAFESLAKYLVEKNLKRIFLISGKQTKKLKLYDKFIEDLHAVGARCFVWTHDGKMADSATIEKCAEECQTYNCEAVVAFGGGTVIDIGKMVAAWLTNPGKSLYQMRGVNQIPNPGLPLFAIATTCSGAESSACAMSKNDQQIVVYYSEQLIPQVVVLDPDLILRLPMENMAASSILALTHAVEAYVSPISKEFPADKANVQIAVPIFFSYLENCYKHGAGNDVYLQFMMAPYYSGVATRRIGFGLTHSFAMYISDKYHIAPGRVCAVLLPAMLDFEFEEVKDDLATLARAAHLCSARATEEDAARAFIAGFKSLCRRVELPAELSFLRMDDFGDIIHKAFNDAFQWSCPKKMTVKQAQSILKKLRY